MTIVLIDLIILISIIFFLFYGIRKWKTLITSQEDNEQDRFENPVEDSRTRFPLWILLIGILLITFIAYIFNLSPLNY